MKHKILLSAAVAVFLLSACSSPESDGKSMAEKINKCKNDYLENVQKMESQFVSGFDQAGYQSRSEAKRAYQEMLENTQTEYQGSLAKVYEQQSEVAKKYAGDRKKYVEFNDAFTTYFDQNLDVQIAQASTREEFPEPVMAKVRTIIPPKPDCSQIQKDLVGHSLTEGVDQGYYSSNWKWVIRDKEISDFNIVTVLSDTPKEYVIKASMRLTSEMGKAFDTNVKIRYVLPQNDDWTIDFVKSLGMYIVNTHVYGDCIKVEKADYGYIINNQCDKALEVGYKGLYTTEWRKRSQVIMPHDRYQVYVSELVIDYVEIP